MQLARAYALSLAVLLLAALPIGAASAGAVRILAERNVPSAGTDLFLLSYPSVSDMLANTGLTQDPVPLPLADTFNIAGMVFGADGRVRILAERIVPSAGTDLFLLNYASLADMLSNTGLTQDPVPLPLADSFDIAGFEIDGGGAVRILAERIVPSAGTDIFLLTYASLADLLANTGLTQDPVPLPLADSFDIAGFALDGDAVRILAERIVPSAGTDLFLLNYASLADMLTNTGLTQDPVPLPLADSFNIGGFGIEPDSVPPPPPGAVPEPAALALFGTGLLGLAMIVRRRASRALTA